MGIRKTNFFNNKSKLIMLLAAFLLLFSIAYAHLEEEVPEAIGEEKIGIEDYIKTTSLNYLFVASIMILVLVLFSLFYKEKEKIKLFLFLGIVAPAIIATAYLAGSTIYLNAVSQTKGPVHWHADYEIWDCNEKIELIKPKGLTNRIGNPLFHDHGDSRIHVEGVVADKRRVDLHMFFETVGGYLDSSMLRIPTDEGVVEIKNSDLCNGEEGKLQAFLYRVKNPEESKKWVFEQLKVKNFPNYILAPYSNIPPGDCIIIEFGKEKEKTDKMCETYKAAMQRGDLNGG
ncbi:hypothetical protein J4458_03210 [Candidatus Woesearchaeota archaeon]|nr:hypothetical protein [Candidatus Woesearchaeota archaeon]